MTCEETCEESMIKLRYGNTNTFFIRGSHGGLLVDTDYAGTLPGFYKALKQNDIRVSDIKYVLATHYHPDHMGLISELMKQGVKLLLIDTQKDYVHYSDGIFARDKLPYTPIDETSATVISC
ncbi:MAG: MBL fold metallo-hydrolase, partial [Methanosphaera sp.]|nr:MBL fold metallo-hydrolase [Methanosphaera sp.]